MDESKKILLTGVLAIFLIVGMVSYFTSSLSGMISFTGDAYPSYRDYSEYACGPDEMPLKTHETRYGTGKMVIVDCIPKDSVVITSRETFPKVGQRWKIPPR